MFQIHPQTRAGKRFHSPLFAVFLLAATWNPVSSPPVPAAARTQPDGLYALLKPNQPVDAKAMEIPHADGISVRTGWENLQPDENTYDWSYLDGILELAKSSGKKVMLRVIPGIHSPGWALSGAKTVSFTPEKGPKRLRGRPLTIPVPWDPVYLKRWSAFVSALGARYNREPALAVIQMAGPTVNTAEMHLPKSKKARTLWSDTGYSRENLTNAWKSAIDAYSAAFPDKYLALDIAVPLYNDGSLEEILSYGKKTIGARFCVQGNWLHGNTRKEFPLYGLVREYSKVTPVGFQMRAPFGNPPGRGPGSGRNSGSLESAVHLGLNAGARYFEIYYRDFFDPGLSNDLKSASDRLSPAR